MIRNDKIQILVKNGTDRRIFLRSEESLKYSKGLVIDTFTNFYCAPTVVICVINNYIELYIASSVRSVIDSFITKEHYFVVLTKYFKK